MFQIQKSWYGVFEGVMGEMGRMGIKGSAVKDLWKGFLFLGSLLLVGLFLNGCQTYAPEPIDLKGYGAAWKDRSLEVMPVEDWTESQNASAPEESGTVFDLADDLSLSEGREVLLRYNAQLRLARAEAGITEAHEEHAGKWNDPVLDILLGRKSVDGEGDELVFGGGMELTLPLSGRPAATRALAGTELEAALAQVTLEEWRLMQELERTWYAWSVLQERRVLLTEHNALLEALHGRVKLLVEAGEIQETEARLLELTLLEGRNALRRVEYEERVAYVELAALMGIHPGVEIELVPALIVAESFSVGEENQEALARRHPEVLRLQREYDTSEAKLKLEIRKQYPDLKVSPNFQDEGTESSFTVGLGLPTAVWNRNLEGIASAQAAREAARVRLGAAYESALAEILGARIAWEMAHAERVAIETEIAPLVDAQLKDMQTLLGLGEINILLLDKSLVDVLESKLSWLDARIAEAQAEVKLRAYEAGDNSGGAATTKESGQ